MFTNQYKPRKKSQQDWAIGSIVKVGFLTLKFTGYIESVNYFQTARLLESLDGTKKYEFTPHHGLARI